jgi:hypothetical protein
MRKCKTSDCNTVMSVHYVLNLFYLVGIFTVCLIVKSNTVNKKYWFKHIIIIILFYYYYMFKKNIIRLGKAMKN